MPSYRQGYPRAWFRPERRRFSCLKGFLIITLSLLCALVWVGVGFVAYIAF